MKILEITSQSRRDFYAIVECEGCGAQNKIGGYDDRRYHDEVMPTMPCKKCGKSRKDLGITQQFTPTKYGAWEDI